MGKSSERERLTELSCAARAYFLCNGSTVPPASGQSIRTPGDRVFNT
jgi:hypothetical protein